MMRQKFSLEVEVNAFNPLAVSIQIAVQALQRAGFKVRVKTEEK